MPTPRAPRNRTLTLSPRERETLESQLLRLREKQGAEDIRDRVIHGDLLEVVELLPRGFVDLMIIDPPYNLGKDFHGKRFARMGDDQYVAYLESWFPRLLPLLKPTASLYLCGDWQSSAALYGVLSKHLCVRNRITWQREKGRGAKRNWKNCQEDIWFATMGDEYHFNVEAVKMKRRVLAPYRSQGQPRDWEETDQGRFRLTHPSNFWDDVTVPYWSMPENTDHPTQKPEKLIAKLVLASSAPGAFVFDPFLGSGTTAVVARKLGRSFCGVECNQEYCCWTLKRLEMAAADQRIQGYEDGVFWERNTAARQQTSPGRGGTQLSLLGPDPPE